MARVKGRYRWGGIFQVDPAFRVKNRQFVDKQGYLLDERRRRIVNEEMKEKVYERRLKRYKVLCVAREDESMAQDWQGKRVSGHYDNSGRFIVDLEERSAHNRCNKDGYLLDAFKNVMVNLKMKLRFKMRNKCKSKLKWPFEQGKSSKAQKRPDQIDIDEIESIEDLEGADLIDEIGSESEEKTADDDEVEYLRYRVDSAQPDEF